MPDSTTGKTDNKQLYDPDYLWAFKKVCSSRLLLTASYLLSNVAMSVLSLFRAKI
jgi:hypothetical protein